MAYYVAEAQRESGSKEKQETINPGNGDCSVM